MIVIVTDNTKFKFVSVGAIPPEGAVIDSPIQGIVRKVVWWPSRESIRQAAPNIIDQIEREELHIEAIIHMWSRK